jgi:hypothetical protein
LSEGALPPSPEATPPEFSGQDEDEPPLSSWRKNSRRRLPKPPRAKGKNLRGGPVSRILSKGSPPLDGHSSGRGVARAPQAANPDAWGRSHPPGLPPRHPYSALLPVGLAVPLLLPVARWALTPPFHPCRAPKAAAVSFLWRFPSDRSARALPGTVASGSPDFPRTVARPRPSSPPRKAPATLQCARLQAPMRAAISAMIAQSRPSSGPLRPCRNRRRKAVSSSASSTSGKP